MSSLSAALGKNAQIYWKSWIRFAFILVVLFEMWKTGLKKLVIIYKYVENYYIDFTQSPNFWERGVFCDKSC